ncbi:neuroendocrine convertase 2 [Tachysurus ichikawai]
MLEAVKCWTAAVLLVFTALLLITGATEDGILTNHLLVQLHQGGNEDAHQLALEYGFGSSRQLPFGERLFHFYPRDTSKTKRKRSLRHRQLLDKDRRVSLQAQYLVPIETGPVPFPGKQ